MNNIIIEIIEFYENERTPSFVKGTLHAYIFLNGVGIDIRGITMVYRKDKFLFYMPSKKGFDEEKKPVHYPIFTFTDIEQQKYFIEQLCKQAKDYLDKNGFYPKTFYKPMSAKNKTEIINTNKNFNIKKTKKQVGVFKTAIK